MYVRDSRKGKITPRMSFLLMAESFVMMCCESVPVTRTKKKRGRTHERISRIESQISFGKQWWWWWWWRLKMRRWYGNPQEPVFSNLALVEGMRGGRILLSWRFFLSCVSFFARESERACRPEWCVVLFCFFSAFYCFLFFLSFFLALSIFLNAICRGENNSKAG